MRRSPLPLVLVLGLTVLGAVAWFTRDPEHPALDWLTHQPGVGPLAERLRTAYRPAPRLPPAPESESETVVERRVVEPTAVEIVAARNLGRAWVRSGTRLRAEPAESSAVVETVERIRTMTVRERRGDWRLVSQVRLDGQLSEGWVRQEELAEPLAEELRRPEPVLPLAAVAPSRELLAETRELMGEDAREMECGPFRLLTDVDGPLLASCPRLAGQLDGIYSRRTGLEPAGGPAEAILLFRSQITFLVFRAWVSPESSRHAFASPARGFIALVSGGRPQEQVRAVLVHELVHLLNRRYLGPALPSWLDEGLAEELAMSRIEPDGTLLPGSLAHWQVNTAAGRLRGGGEVERDELRLGLRWGELPTLEELMALDSSAFQAEERFQLHYALSAFWVRYLLSGESPAGGEAFRRYLAAVAVGESLDEELLVSRLGSSLGELESGFRRWLESGV